MVYETEKAAKVHSGYRVIDGWIDGYVLELRRVWNYD
jgi:hypothetical protein